jgi:hypothetical protein
MDACHCARSRHSGHMPGTTRGSPITLGMRAAACVAGQILCGLLVVDAARAQASGSWYYCDPSHAYYPYVSTCPVPWRAVAPHAYGQTSPPAAQPGQPVRGREHPPCLETTGGPVKLTRSQHSCHQTQAVQDSLDRMAEARIPQIAEMPACQQPLPHGGTMLGQGRLRSGDLPRA